MQSLFFTIPFVAFPAPIALRVLLHPFCSQIIIVGWDQNLAKHYDILRINECPLKLSFSSFLCFCIKVIFYFCFNHSYSVWWKEIVYDFFSPKEGGFDDIVSVGMRVSGTYVKCKVLKGCASVMSFTEQLFKKGVHSPYCPCILFAKLTYLCYICSLCTTWGITTSTPILHANIPLWKIYSHS